MTSCRLGGEVVALTAEACTQSDDNPLLWLCMTADDKGRVCLVWSWCPRGALVHFSLRMSGRRAQLRRYRSESDAWLWAREATFSEMCPPANNPWHKPGAIHLPWLHFAHFLSLSLDIMRCANLFPREQSAHFILWFNWEAKIIQYYSFPWWPKFCRHLCIAESYRQTLFMNVPHRQRRVTRS